MMTLIAVDDIKQSLRDGVDVESLVLQVGAFNGLDSVAARHLVEKAKAEISEAARTQASPTWEAPAHEDISLHELDSMELGLDPFDENDAKLADAIIEAKRVKVANAEIQAEADGKDEVKSPLAGALWMAARGIPQAPLEIREKACHLKGWEEKASTSPEQIAAWEQEKPGRNWGSVAKAVPGGICILEVDSREVPERIKADTGKDVFQELQFRVRSSAGRGHFYMKQTPASIAAGNISQGFVKHEDWSLRVDRQYVVSPFSWHPTSGKQYELIADGEIPEVPAWLIEWCIGQKVEKKKLADSLDDQSPITEGSRNGTLTSIAGKARQALKMDQAQLTTYLLDVNQKRCHPPLPDEEVRTIAESIARYEVKDERVFRNGVPMGSNPDVTQPKSVEEASAFAKAQEERRQQERNGATTPGTPFVSYLEAKSVLVGETIPAFDDTVITGIFRDVVGLATEGTTMPRQFAFLAAKIFVGARLSATMEFEGVDGDSSYYGTAIGLTGTGKGLAWRRTIEKILAPSSVKDKGLKLFTDVDSGAGLRDAFFEPPEKQPVLLYIDEVTALGHKAGERKNPEIVDALVTLANSNSITRMKSKKGSKDKNAIRTHDNAHLSVYMCGQDGEAFMSSFPGKTKIGLWDRFYPEYARSIEAGELPDIDVTQAASLLTRLYSLPFSGKMRMNDDVKAELELFWKAQPAEVRTKVRFKTYLMLDMYMAAWSQGRMTAQIDDLDVAIRIFQRQLIIRREHFRGEIPDRVGYYVGLLKKIVEGQRTMLNKHDAPLNKIAMSIRDYQTDTNAFRDNEVQTFMQAWRIFFGQHLVKVLTRARNGQLYEKYLPMPFEDESWLPQEQPVEIRGRNEWVIVV